MLTHDAILAGVRRDDVFQWLTVPENHGQLLRPALSRFVSGQAQTGQMGRLLPTAIRYEVLEAKGKIVQVMVHPFGPLRISVASRQPRPTTLVTLHLDALPRRPWVQRRVNRLMGTMCQQLKAELVP